MVSSHSLPTHLPWLSRVYRRISTSSTLGIAYFWAVVLPLILSVESLVVATCGGGTGWLVAAAALFVLGAGLYAAAEYAEQQFIRYMPRRVYGSVRVTVKNASVAIKPPHPVRVVRSRRMK